MRVWRKKLSRLYTCFFFVGLPLICVRAQTDPLPSWNRRVRGEGHEGRQR